MSANEELARAMLDISLEVWHAYRVELLLLAAVLLLAIRVKTQWQSAKVAEAQFQGVRTQKPPFNQTGTPEKQWTVPPARSNSLLTSKAWQKIEGPKRFRGSRTNTSQLSTALPPSGQSNPRVLPIILYYSLGGSTTKAADDLRQKLAQRSKTCNAYTIDAELHDIADLDFDDFFVTPRSSGIGILPYYLLLLPTYNIDSELDTFIQSLEETHNDFRIDTAPLQTIAGYSVFGFGDREGWPTEQQGFCSQAKEVDKWMARLSAGKRAYPMGMGDARTDAKQSLENWQKGNFDIMESIAQGHGLGEGMPGSGAAVESDEESSGSEDSDLTPSRPRISKKRKRTTPTADLEDIRAPVPATDLEIDFTTSSAYVAPPKEMVPKSSTTYNALTKQGYTIVGSHSGVKICRWTKSALRGRGSCYKYSFYGIASHRCMEATPSLSCSNKCVFCWRHGTNPVSTTWRWTVDPPELVFAGIKAGHYSKIKSLRGVPGVRAERFAEALAIRHCALSLVGEPIFYPHINALLGMLHAERISTFLVCNAQHPQQLRDLAKVTQLYVSIDAPTRDRLKKVDRPLHRDFWERFLECMDILRARREEQRTVFRLTLVKGFNLDDDGDREDVRGYADLVERARPAFVEVKGVTFCGTSTAGAAGLTMQNVPFYREVCAFVEALDRELEGRGLGYGVAVEHAHSCCILLAEKERFLKEDGWHTLIDYESFFDRLESGEEFGPADYVGEQTPEWALYGNGGFDPRDQRVDRKGKVKEDVEVDRGASKVRMIEI